ncbi:phage tail sheath subtilisin-like domain-containing protein [Rahnella aceris]|uniref:phage tail sheath subtilisin-like domain-containing protein n=1 Tax=Rahnella sp. (strain Y9602) TaxID=2703885 RepID=UPI001C2787C2|nr:phage tail sheath subtilisin-like domain-containing protein [Rahnella aceris]MBU9866816.1 phage tail sheath subtilisin-like domain-containing protein [Rahnella aceris]
MSISFNTTPSDTRVPLFWAEMDNSQANTAIADQPSLIIGHALPDSAMTLNTMTLVSNIGEFKQQAGRGSQLARMAAAYRDVDTTGTLWAIAIPVGSGAVAASCEITIGGSAISPGVISLYIGRQRVQVGVSAGDDPEDVIANIVTAINDNPDLPVSAVVDGTTIVVLRAKNPGLWGNEIPVSINYYSSVGGETTPEGLTVSISTMSGAVGAPDLTAAMAAFGDEAGDFIACPFNDSTSLASMANAMNDTSGRWAPGRQSYGHVYSAKFGSLSSLQAYGVTLNQQHITLSGVEEKNQTCVDELAALSAARNAVFIRNDPARPTQTGELNGALPAPAGARFDRTGQGTLLKSGIATFYAQAGAMFIQRAITTYQKNKFGDADNSYLDSETLHTSAYVLRQLKLCITSKYPRHKLANDGTRYGGGQAIVTPSTIKAEMCAQYRQMELAGIVENFELFKKYLIVERDRNDPNRVNVLFPPDYINQLRVFAVINQFRLQYAEEAA